MTGTASHSDAAFIFSSKPPVLPDAFETIYLAPIILIWAVFTSWVKGPWAAIIWETGIPAFSQASRDEATGSTLAHTLDISSPM